MSFPHIRVWQIQDAPDEMKRLCPARYLRSDGESAVTAVWLAHVPAAYGWVGWLEGSEYGCSETCEHQLDDGSYVAIGLHHNWCGHQAAAELPVDNNRCIRVWRYGDERAPVSVPSTDDADWVAQVPSDYVLADIPWLEGGSNFGCCAVDAHPLPDGSELRVGCHS